MNPKKFNSSVKLKVADIFFPSISPIQMHIEPFQKRLKILLAIFPALATAEVLFMILNLRDHQYHEKCEFI